MFLPGLVRFSSSTEGGLAKFPVVHSERETPLPIPNRAVKPLSADGTWRATSWESRSPPVLAQRPAMEIAGRFSFQACVAKRAIAECQAPVLRRLSLRARPSQGRAAGRTG